MFKNPRTTLAGGVAIAAAIGVIGKMYLTGMWDPNVLGATLINVLTGLGLIAAKDS